MKYRLFAALMAAALLLAGCTDRREAEKSETEQSPAVSAPAQTLRPLQFALLGTVDAELYTDTEYSLYIPVEDWTLELECDEEIPHNTWEADGESDAKLTVYHYENMSFMVARDRFIKDSGYVFGDALGGELGDPLCATDRDGDVCCVMVAEGGRGTTYVITWEYAEAEQETLGQVLTAMANTFELAE